MDLLLIKQRLPHISHNALSTVLRIAKEEGLPEHAHRHRLRAAIDNMVRTLTLYGPIHQYIDVPLKGDRDPIKLEVQHPLAMLSFIAKNSPFLSGVIRDSLQMFPCTPDKKWDLVIYNDEVTPGNPLAHNNARKAELFYWSILQWGSHVLSNELAWFELCVLRSAERKLVLGGLSGVLALLLQHLFFNQDSVDVSRGGVCIELDDGSYVTLWLDLGIILADESALHHMCNFKGHQG